MEDLVEAILRGIFEIVIEVLIKGPGYLILKLFGSRSQTDPDGCLVFAVGCLFWLIVALVAWAVCQ